MRSFRSILAASCLAVAVTFGATPALAHHSFGHYAMDKTTEIQGVISKWEWGNPHCWLFVDVAGADGKTVTYGFELRSPGELLRGGWKRNSIKVGDTLKVAFRPMKDGTPAGLLVRANDATGKLIGNPMPSGPPPAGPPGGAAPPRP
ncbi:MAG TPA: DUF6152 family protein [Hyphomonadaceae bacterium]|jgi:hypothetical protein|nr:DUF6152 family protein [Hyphomonadaceae bacterium]